MHNKITNRERNIAIFLLILFIGYFGNNTFFTHVHYINNIAIVHSHPFGGANHTHSSASLNTISLLNSVTLISAVSATIGIIVLHILYTLKYNRCPKRGSIAITHYSLRAPPFIG
ncbi:MAG: hypothetical protein PHR45_02080 [Muribaculaceae bacterium]|nr:hypothetical protein [Muribaculaceae bacterium]